ncbi:MAG: hypothetical protein IPM37_03530 [Hahellaceae bacterium]|nr:hypothetical protein [Hahellaceae bacterium]
MDAARVLALAHGISETNTLSRLRGAGSCRRAPNHPT